MNKNISVVIVALLVVVGGFYITSKKGEEPAMTDKVKDTMLVESGEKAMIEKGVAEDMAMAQVGTYEAYASEKVALASSSHNVVLFFRAGWCPSCRAIDADIKANLSKIPASLTILDVNYDDSTTLKQKYGVTYQHTFVQVDEKGTLINKWSGSPTLSALVAEVKK